MIGKVDLKDIRLNGKLAILVDGFVLLTYIPLKELIVLHEEKGQKEEVYGAKLPDRKGFQKSL